MNATTTDINRWFEQVLADHRRSGLLKKDWVKLAEEDSGISPLQRETLAQLPPNYVAELQAAMARVVDHGGSIRIERESEQGEGTLVVRPHAVAKESAAENPGTGLSFNIPVYVCTFDAHCRHWHCHWTRI